MYEKTQSQFGNFPFGPLRERTPRAARPKPAQEGEGGKTVYPVNLHKALINALSEAQQALDQGPPAPQSQDAAKNPPFYQIYSQLHGLETSKTVPESDLAVPAGYSERKRHPSK